MKRAVFVAVAACTMCLSSNAETTFPSRQTILDFIARYEAPGGYDQVYSGTPAPRPRPLTRMTVGEVLEWQREIRPRVTSTAAGRYQIIYKTLVRLVDSYRTEFRTIGVARNCRQPGPGKTCGSHGLSWRHVSPTVTGRIGRQCHGRLAASLIRIQRHPRRDRARSQGCA